MLLTSCWQQHCLHGPTEPGTPLKVRSQCDVPGCTLVVSIDSEHTASSEFAAHSSSVMDDLMY